jgi:hypothetical protein
MDFRSLNLKRDQAKAHADPLDIFAEAVQRGPIEQLRGSQQDALKAWHREHRDKSDVLLSIDTGGGKSLVGLLAAQSLCNTEARPVLYMCPSIVLVEQIAQQAIDAGLAVDTYLSGAHSAPDLFHSARAPCVTTYHAIFNGRSTFRDLTLGGAVFDDAHIAESIIRQCYTASVRPSHSAYKALADFCFGAFKSTPFESECTKRLKGSAIGDQTPMLVPVFYCIDHLEQLASILSTTASDDDLQFASAHLIDHAAHIMCLVGTGVIELTPWTLPVHESLPFRHCNRRLYLSATIPSARSFIRAFGRQASATIEPEGKTNAAQRVFVIPPPKHLQARRAFALEMLKARRAAILVPSNVQAAEWEMIGMRLPRGSGLEVLKKFRESTAGRLVLVARYDGLDLPGDVCKALIVEGLPRGENLAESFFASVLQLQDEQSRRVADRLTQGLGRIFRSNRDHGVVILTDITLESWLRQPAKASLLPALLQRQLLLSFALAEELGQGVSSDDWSGMLTQIIDGDPGWDEFYKREIAQLEAKPICEAADSLEPVVLAEAEVGALLWSHRYREALEGIANLISRYGSELSNGHLAWLNHIGGLIAQLNNDSVAAKTYYDSAQRLHARLWQWRTAGTSQELTGDVKASTQARRCASRLASGWRSDLDEVQSALTGHGGANGALHSQAIAKLGELLGLHGKSADDETGGKGPDAVWRSPDYSSAMSIEAKTNKKEGTQYSKTEIAQSVSSWQWVADEYGVAEVVPLIVGPQSKVADQASPPPGLRVVELSDLIAVAVRLLAALTLVEKTNTDSDPASWMENALRMHGLKYMNLVQGLPGVLAVDLRDR